MISHYLKAIEEYPEMKDFYHAIHQDMVLENETILMLFRISESISEVPRSMRKDVEYYATLFLQYYIISRAFPLT